MHGEGNQDLAGGKAINAFVSVLLGHARIGSLSCLAMVCSEHRVSSHNSDWFHSMIAAGTLCSRVGPQFQVLPPSLHFLIAGSPIRRRTSDIICLCVGLPICSWQHSKMTFHLSQLQPSQPLPLRKSESPSSRLFNSEVLLCSKAASIVATLDIKSDARRSLTMAHLMPF